MKADLKALINTFDRRDKVKLTLVVLGQFIVALLDLLSLAAIYPLMQIVTGTPLGQGAVGVLHELLGHQVRNSFIVTLAALMILAFLLKAIFAAALNWWSAGFIAWLQARTSRRLLATFLAEDYLRHRRRNVAEIMRAVGSATAAAHGQVIGGLIAILSALMSIVLIAALLLYTAPVPTLAAILYFAVVVFALQRILAPANRLAGRDAQHASWISSHALVDAVSGYREAILHDAQPFLLRRFEEGNRMAVESARLANFLSSLPKFLLELVTMVGLVLLIVVELVTGDGGAPVPTLSLFVAAAIKILPLMVALTTTIGIVRVGREGLTICVEALKENDRFNDAFLTPDGSIREAQAAPASVPRSAPIRLDSVSFRYPRGLQDVVRDISLEIPAGASVAFCGPSGSGKTTLVNIILGLIPPTTGSVTYDAVETGQAGRAWRDIVAYVPQDVYLTDDTLAGNVAFGVPESERDESLILHSLERAELSGLLAELPDGIDTLVGERGSRLSGGQRQRLGIARALYRSPRVLVLDEATSALDNETEHRIGQTVQALQGDITTIIVAHRLSTVRNVDKLVFLSGGTLRAMGSFDEVVRESPEFAHLVALGSLEPSAISREVN